MVRDEVEILKLVKAQYWNKLIDYYYDNVHWDEPGPPSIYEWLDRDFKANTNLHAKFIHFKDPARMNWFMMRWNT